MADPGTGPTSAGTPSSKSTGSQTLDRGIRALVMVAASSGGLSVQEVAKRYFDRNRLLKVGESFLQFATINEQFALVDQRGRG